MTEGLKLINNRQTKLNSVKERSLRSRKHWLNMEEEATHELENIVAYVYGKKLASLRQIARELGWSKTKVYDTVKRANERNVKQMKAGHE